MVTMLVTVLLAAASPADVVDTAVVCPASFRAALRPWVEHREAQGHRLAFVSNQQTGAQIRHDIRELAQPGGLRFVVLVGDASPAAANDAHLCERTVPTHLAAAKVNVRWGSEPEIATDNWFADLDDDNVPDVALGRLTADSPEELSVMVRKILNYERSADYGSWRRRVNFIAGVGGFGKLADTVLEMATKKFLTEGIPTEYCTTMTYGSWHSPYCPDPRLFHDAAIVRFNEGCLFWVYIGHGQKRHLDYVSVPGAYYPILHADDADRLSSIRGNPIAIFLACYTGAFDQPQDCLAEELLRRENGPVAVYCGSRVTMPYAMAVMSNELLDEYFHQQRETLGEVLLNAKRRMVADAPPAEQTGVNQRALLDAIASAISPSAALLAEERAEHLALFNLLGDPLLRLHRSQPVALTVPESATAGELLEISGVAPSAGRCTVELVCGRDRLRFTAPDRPYFDDDDQSLRQYSDVYRDANDQCWTSATLAVEPGEFHAQLAVPAETLGPCHIRVFIEGPEQSALGSADVYVRRLKKESRP